ncbi:hypothetical protein ACFFRR_003004 [Megaselia abdita]
MRLLPFPGPPPPELPPPPLPHLRSLPPEPPSGINGANKELKLRANLLLIMEDTSNTYKEQMKVQNATNKPKNQSRLYGCLSYTFPSVEIYKSEETSIELQSFLLTSSNVHHFCNLNKKLQKHNFGNT